MYCASQAAPRKVVLELGSNAALVVAADADLDAAADAVVRGGFYASGQACISVQRVIAVEEVAGELERRIAERLPHIAVGDPQCQGGGCLPEIAPCDATLPCCDGLQCTNGVCTALSGGFLHIPRKGTFQVSESFRRCED